MNFVIWCLVSALAASTADKWQWPEQAASVRIDTKVRFLDSADRKRGSRRQGEGSDQESVQADEIPFHQAFETDGFYNRPPGAGRYPVRVETLAYRVDGKAVYPVHNSRKNYNDGTLDSLRYCRCVDTPDCQPSQDSHRACGSGKYLCCYKNPNKEVSHQSEYFNEINDERPSLLPGQDTYARPFPPPPNSGIDGAFGPGHSHEIALLGAADRPVPVGPAGSAGRPGVLVGPEGPTGVIGPQAPNDDRRHPAVLVGPNGPSGVIGPIHNNGELVGPEGLADALPSQTAQRGVLVGPGGPTGIIGPGGYNQRPRLVGPGGPTGFIGPRMRGYLGRFFNEYMGRQAGPGVLVGPGGPTGVIGPAGRPLLVGPGGPTGIIGPQY